MSLMDQLPDVMVEVFLDGFLIKAIPPSQRPVMLQDNIYPNYLILHV